jgi:Flp pilus assembly pilin Flp
MPAPLHHKEAIVMKGPYTPVAFRVTVRNMKKLERPPENKKGQTLVEYALILAFISIVAISVLITLSQNIRGTYSKITSSLVSAQSSH